MDNILKALKTDPNIQVFERDRNIKALQTDPDIKAFRRGGF